MRVGEGNSIASSLSSSGSALIVRPLLGLLWIWHKALSPLLGQHCRFEPTCSQYTAQALKEHGLLRGLALGLRRVVRCNSLFTGGFDPIPLRQPEGGESRRNT